MGLHRHNRRAEIIPSALALLSHYHTLARCFRSLVLRVTAFAYLNANTAAKFKVEAVPLSCTTTRSPRSGQPCELYGRLNPTVNLQSIRISLASLCRSWFTEVPGLKLFSRYTEYVFAFNVHVGVEPTVNRFNGDLTTNVKCATYIDVRTQLIHTLLRHIIQHTVCRSSC